MKALFPPSAWLLAAASLLVLAGCKKDTPFNPHEITKPYYFQAVLDGDTITYQEEVDGYGNIVGDFYGGQVTNGYEYAPFTCLASDAAVNSPSPTPAELSESGAVSIVTMTGSPVTDLQTYRTLFQSGQMGYGYLSRTPSTAGTSGAFVSIYDANGVEWNTNNGAQDSTASFLITEYYSSVDNDRFPATQQIFGAEFNCKVYNVAGNSKTLTGGKIRGRMIIFQ